MLWSMTRKSDSSSKAAAGRKTKARGTAVRPDAAKPAPRRVGRRPKSVDGSAELSRAAVIDRAVQIAQQESLDDLSMVRLARELGITPGLVHYYVGSRDALISAIVNLAYRERLEALPPLTGSWRHDLREIARVSRATMRKWRGVAAYVATRNRSRLFQGESGDETDWGLAFFDRVATILKNGGFTAEQAAMAYHLTMLFLVSVGSADANRLMPAAHREFILGYLARPAAVARAGAQFVAEPFTRIDADATFEAGLEVLFDGFEGWLGGAVANGIEPLTTARRRRAARAVR
jgi:AcrR family transcriptional regulator